MDSEISNNIDINNFVGRDLPPEILNQLKIAGRVKFSPKPSVQSNDSSTESDSPTTTVNLDEYITSVKENEDLVKNLEDLYDLLTKDMNIPPPNKIVANAAKALNGDGNDHITQETVKKAEAIMDYLPILTTGDDPLAATLSGEYGVDGKFLDCNEITQGLADELLKNKELHQQKNKPTPTDYSTKVAEQHQTRMLNIKKELLNQLLWNYLWYNLVKILLINPLNKVVSKIYPKFIRRRLQKLVRKIEKYLLCTVPYKLYPRYKPNEQLNCDNTNLNGDNCGPIPKDPYSVDVGSEDPRNPFKDQPANTLDDPEEKDCVSIEELIREAVNTSPDGLGINPECIGNAKLVLDAVVADAISSGK